MSKISQQAATFAYENAVKVLDVTPEHPLQKPLNEFLAHRYRMSPPMKRTTEQNRKAVEIIIAKVLFAK